VCVSKLGHYPIVLGIPLLRIHDVAAQCSSNTVTFGSHYCITHCHDAHILVQGVTEEPPEPVYSEKEEIFNPQIQPQRPYQSNWVKLDGWSFFRTVKYGKLTIFKGSPYDIDKPIETKDVKERAPEQIVPKQYHELLSHFRKVLRDQSRPHRPWIEHELHLSDSETTTWGLLDWMSRTELVVLEEWVEENMSKRIIQPSSSLFAAPVLVA